MIGDMHDAVATDMISSLPDDVLSHILSFLKAKEVVQTCILSKRWSTIWASVPVLKFDFDEFWTCNPSDCDNIQVRKCEDKFHRFVNGVLENRGPSRLDTFEYFWLNYDGHYGDTFLEWLDSVVDLMPRVIRVYIHSKNMLNLPDSLFRCASLQNLTLSIDSVTDIDDDDKTFIGPRSINLPSLEVLELRDAELPDGFTRKLSVACPTLERLILHRCDLGMSDITSDVLKELDIRECWLFEQMRISCPGLVSLCIQSSYPTGDILLENMTSLQNAIIRFYPSDRYFLDYPLPILNVLSGLSNATSIKLHVCLQMKEQLEKDFPRCKTFKSLKSLEIGEWDMTNEFDLIACFLENSPNLQELTLCLNEDSQVNTEEEAGKEVLRVVSFQRILRRLRSFVGRRLRSFLGRRIDWSRF